jgi:hypothetical protein
MEGRLADQCIEAEHDSSSELLCDPGDDKLLLSPFINEAFALLSVRHLFAPGEGGGLLLMMTAYY